MVKYILIIFITVLCSCNKIEQPNKDYFTGVWEAEKGGKLNLNEDGTFTAKGINFNYIYDYDIIIDFNGKWKIDQYNYKDKKLRILLESDYTYENFNFDNTYIKDEKEFSYEVGFSLIASGKGIFENKPPWELFTWIEDPDDMNKYKFIKQ